MGVVINNLSFHYDGQDVLSDINLDLSENRIGIIGANGSGKSTLARLMAGLIKPIQGNILVNTVDVFTDRKHALDHVGIIFQNPDHQIIFPTCWEEIAFGLRSKGQNKKEAEQSARRILNRFGRGHWADRLTYNLSQGQRHYLCLMAVLAMEPHVLILDEPYAGLDIPTSYALQKSLAQLSQQLIMISHDSAQFIHYDRLIWLDQGMVLADGDVGEVLETYQSEMQKRISDALA